MKGDADPGEASVEEEGIGKSLCLWMVDPQRLCFLRLLGLEDSCQGVAEVLNHISQASLQYSWELLKNPRKI